MQGRADSRMPQNLLDRLRMDIVRDMDGSTVTVPAEPRLPANMAPHFQVASIQMPLTAGIGRAGTVRESIDLALPTMYNTRYERAF
jgi:hypothetical protein